MAAATWEEVQKAAIATNDYSTTPLWAAALEVLNTGDYRQKADKSFAVAHAFRSGSMAIGSPSPSELVVPSSPARPADVEMVDARKVKSANKKGLLHALCHAESYAIDLAWDILVRFGYSPSTWAPTEVLESSSSSSSSDAASDAAAGRLPDAFFADWVTVAEEEAKHFTKWRLRLENGFGGRYGDLPAHNSLWESAAETSHSLPSRLAIVHCVHEARGLDVYTAMMKRLSNGNDSESVAVLEMNHKEEIGHVAAGRRWLGYCTARFAFPDESEEQQKRRTVEVYHKYVHKYFRGGLKPPFNEKSRLATGMTPDWWEPLVPPQIAAAAAAASASAADGKEEEEIEPADMG
jgi:uncharacterized ferritin-like protein (DUF455 family)